MSHSSHRAAPREQGSLMTYVMGYGLSIVLTLSAFFLIQAHLDVGSGFLSKVSLIAILMVLAIEQLIVQVVCFLHLDQERQPRWRLIAFIFSVLFVITVVAGSLWIMSHLNHNMMPPSEVDAHMLDQ